MLGTLSIQSRLELRQELSERFPFLSDDNEPEPSADELITALKDLDSELSLDFPEVDA